MALYPTCRSNHCICGGNLYLWTKEISKVQVKSIYSQKNNALTIFKVFGYSLSWFVFLPFQQTMPGVRQFSIKISTSMLFLISKSVFHSSVFTSSNFVHDSSLFFRQTMWRKWSPTPATFNV